MTAAPPYLLIARWRRAGAWLLLAVLSVLAPLAMAQPASESRLALIIGNASYQVSPLRNPVNDARLMEAALRDAGFRVFRAENATRREMQRMIRDFGELLKREGGVGLFYFSGHGLQVKGANYLVPVDADIRAEDEVAFDSVDAQSVLEKMESAGNRMNLLILDACRSNPFASAGRAATRGLAQMNAPSGTLVAYATAPGTVALDGAGTNSPYTHHLARAIRQPGMPVEEVFKQVRSAVRRDTNNAQTPWENTALEGQFYFRAATQVAAPAPTPGPTHSAAPAAAPAADTASMELAFWDSIKSSARPAELQAYLDRFPNGIFSGLARARLADAAPRPAVQPATPTVLAMAAPAATLSANSPVAMGLAPTLGRYSVKDHLTNGTDQIDVHVSTGADGASVYSTGDEVAANGAVRVVRIGPYVSRLVTGSLWTLPAQAGTSGVASLHVRELPAPMQATWRVLRADANGAEVELKFSVANLGISTMTPPRTGTWRGQYRGKSHIPATSNLDSRHAGTVDLVSTQWLPPDAGPR